MYAASISQYVSIYQNRNTRYETSINRSSEVDEELDRYVVNRDLHFFIAWLLAVGRYIVIVDSRRYNEIFPADIQAVKREIMIHG